MSGVRVSPGSPSTRKQRNHAIQSAHISIKLRRQYEHPHPRALRAAIHLVIPDHHCLAWFHAERLRGRKKYRRIGLLSTDLERVRVGVHKRVETMLSEYRAQIGGHVTDDADLQPPPPHRLKSRARVRVGNP